MARRKPKEQRQHPRIASRFPVLTGTDPLGLIEMESVNLSLDGVYCNSRHYLAPMTKLRITLHLPSIDGVSTKPQAPIQADAIVVRVVPGGEGNPERYELALFFSRMESRDRIQLAQYLDWKKKEAT